MSEITVKMFPAKNGDCFLVSLGVENKKHILIDCGYAETYNNFLKSELETIAKNKEMIDLMVVSHVDQDHILGAISFLKDNNKSHFIKIGEIWHNSYRHLQFNERKVKKISSEEEKILKGIIALGNSHVERMKLKDGTKSISTRQGSSLASLILEGQYSWNESFEGNAINIDNENIIQNDDYTLHLLSPNTEKLNKLSNKWLRDLMKIDLNFSLSDEAIFDDAYEFHMIQQEERKIETRKISSSVSDTKFIEEIICAEEEKDSSVINGSSISFIIEYNGKKLLFLADAHPDIIFDNISKLENNYFDLIKVSHHGSAKNTTNELAKILNSSLFLISTNGKGKQSHPDFESLAKIVYHQTNFKELFFNYETNNAKKIDDNILKKMYNYTLYISDGSKPTKIEL